MEVNRLEAHDRLESVKQQGLDISKCCQDLIDQRPFDDHAFYIWAHARTMDDGITKNLLWQPRLTKPHAGTNSMLFKVKPGSDEVKIIWMIPDEALWDNFKKGQLMENEIVYNSIQDYLHNRTKLEAKEPDDMTNKQIKDFYLAKYGKNKNKVKLLRL